MIVNFCEPKSEKLEFVHSNVYGPTLVPIGFKIPEDEWKSWEISLKHLKVFGCVSYLKVKDSEIDKLDAKKMKCTFICYRLDGGVPLWDNENEKVIKSR